MLRLFPLTKTTYDKRIFDFACDAILTPTAVITEVVSITGGLGGMTFGPGVINDVATTYPPGITVRIGAVIQVKISDGTIPAGMSELPCPIHVRFKTSLGEEIEENVTLILSNSAETSCGC